MANITVDIQARVVGYEQSIKSLQAALAKVDPGSDIGKSIAKAISQASDQVKSLSKNMFPKASSDSQIDAIIEKTNRAGEAIQHVATLLQSVQVSDLNLGAFGGDLENFRSQISALETELNSKLNQGILNVVNNSDQLKNIFQSLGTDLTKANASTLFEDLKRGAADAAKEVASAEKALKSIQEKKLDNELIGNKLQGSLLSTEAGRKQLDVELNNIMNSYDNQFNAIREKMAESLSQLNLQDGGKKLLDSFFQDLTPNNIKDKIDSLYKELSANFGSKQDFYNAIFGNGSTDLKNKTQVAKLFDFNQDTEYIKTQFRAFLSKVSGELKPEQLFQINRLIDEGSLKQAAQKTTKDLDAAYGSVQTEIKKQTEKTEEILKQEKTAESNLNIAKTNESNINSANTQLLSQIESLRQQNADLQKQIDSLREQLNQKLSGEVKNIHSTGATQNSNINQGLRESLEISEAYKNQLAQVAAKEQALGKLQGVVQRWFSIYAAIRMVRQAIDSVISTIKELDATITEIAIVTSMDQSELWDQMPKYTQLARDYAASISGVYQVSQLYYQQGLQTADVMALTEQTLKMARISGLDYAQATDYMTNAVRSFKMEMTDAQRVVDVYSAIAASSATSVTELASAMSKTASSAQAVGSSFENTTAMMAVMIEATRESAENIGSAMKSIISRYGEMTSDPSKLVDSEGQEMSLNRVDKALQTVGISIHNTAGEFRNFDEVIMELAQKWNTIDTNTQRYIATIMAGNRQQSRFLALVSSYDRLRELSAEAADSEDASQLQFLKTLDSVAAKTQQIETSIQSLYTSSGLEKLYKNILDFANAIITSLDNLSAKNGLVTTIGKIGGVFTTLATLVTTVFTSVKSHYSMAKAQMMSEAKVAAAAELQEEVNKTHQLGLIWDEETNTYIRQKRTEVMAARQAAADKLEVEQKAAGEIAALQKQITKQQRTTRIGMVASTAGMVLGTIGAKLDVNKNREGKALATGASGLLSGVGTTLMMWKTMGPAVAIISGLLSGLPSIIEAIGLRTESVTEKVERLSKAVEETNNERLKSKSDLQTLADYKKKYDELQAASYESNEAKEEFVKIQNEIAASYPELITSMTIEGNYIVDMTDGYKQLAMAKAEAYKTDYLNNLSAELAGLNDLDYVLKNIYGKDPIKQNSPWLGSWFNNSSTANQIRQKDLNNFEVNEATLQDLFGKFTRESMGVDYHPNGGAPGAGALIGQLFYDSSGKQYTLTDEGEQVYQQIIEKARDFAAQGIPNQNAITQLVELFPEFANEISTFMENNYNDLIVAMNAIKYQEELIDNRMNTAMTEWISVLGDLTGYKTTNYQGQFMAKQLGREWEGFQQDVEKGTRTDAAGITIAKVGDYITDENGVYRQKTQVDLWKEFINIYDYQWYRQMEEHTRYLQNDSIDTLSQDKGKYNKANLQKQKGYALLQEAQTDFMKDYDTAATKAQTTYAQYIHSILPEGSKLSDSLLALSDINNGFGYDFLSGIVAQIKKVNDNTSLALTQQENIITDLADAWTAILAIEDPDIQAQVLSQFNSADLTSLTGIAKFINNISNIDGFDLTAINLDTYLTNLKQHIEVNIAGELESYFSTIQSEVNTFSKAISSAANGMDLKAASEMAAKLGTTLNDENFEIINGKFYYKDLEAIRNAYLSENDQLKNELIDSLNIQYSQLQNYDETLWDGIQSGIWSIEELDKYLSLPEQQDFEKSTSFTANSLIAEYSKYQEALATGAATTGTTFLKYLTQQINNEFNQNTNATLKYISQNAAITSIKTGDMQGFIETSGLMEEAITAAEKEVFSQYAESRAEALSNEAVAWNQQLEEQLLSQAKSEAPEDYYKQAELDLIKAGGISESELNAIAKVLLQRNQNQLNTILEEEKNRDFQAEAEDKWIQNGGTSLEDIQKEAKRLNDRDFTESENIQLEEYYQRFNDNVEEAENAFIQDRLSQLYTSRAEQIAQIKADLIQQSTDRIQKAQENATWDASLQEASDAWEAIYDHDMVRERAQQLADEAKAFNKQMKNAAKWKPTDPEFYMAQAMDEIKQEQDAAIQAQAEQWAQAQIDLAKEGRFSEIESDTVKQHAALIYDTYHSINESIANSMISAIGDGKGLIKVTETNQEALEKLKLEHQGWLSGDTTVGSYITIAAEKLLDNASQFEQFIATSFDTNADRIKGLTKFHNNQYKNSSIGSFDKVLTTENFAYEDLLNYLVNTKNVDLTQHVTDIPTYMKAMGLAFNSVGEVIVTNYTAWIQDLEWTANILKNNPNASQEEQNSIQAKLDNAKHAQEQAIASGFDGILKDYSNISVESVEALANALGVSYEYIISYLTSNGNGTYQLDTSKLPALLSKLKDKVSQATIDSIEKSISSIGDAYLSNIKNATSYATKGASSLADVEAFRQSYADIVGKTLSDDAFSYNSALQSFVLNESYMDEYIDAQREKLRQLNYSEEFIKQYIKDQTDRAIQDNIALDGFLNADTNKAKNDEANKLIQQIRGLSNYETIQHRAAAMASSKIQNIVVHNVEELQEKYDLAILEVLESGGQNAVDLLKQIKPDASQEELEAAFNSQINKLNDALSQVGDLVAGQFIGTEGKLYEILSDIQAVDTNGVIVEGFRMVEAYARIYAEMKETATSTTADLNNAYVQLLTAQDQESVDLIEALNNASGMTYEAIGQIFTRYGIELEQALLNSENAGIARVGYNKIAITDFTKFKGYIEQAIGHTIEVGTQEYLDAYSAYVDSQIDMRSQGKNNLQTAFDQLKNVTEAKIGDLLNVTYLEDAFDKSTKTSKDTLVQIAEKFGASIKDGILTISKYTDVPGLLQAVAEEAGRAGLLIPEQLAELNDAIAGMLSNIASLISNGITGTLNNTDALSLQNWAEKQGLQPLEFNQTAEGLQLTAESIALVYAEMKRLNSLQAQSLLTTIIESNDRYSTLASTLQAAAEVTQRIDFTRATISNPSRTVMGDVGAKGVALITPVLPDGTELGDDWAKTLATKYANGEINLNTKLQGSDGRELSYTLEDVSRGLYTEENAVQQATAAMQSYNAAAESATEANKDFTASLDSLTAQSSLMSDIVLNKLTDPDAMNFMSDKLPDNYQAAINAWENTSKAMKTLNQAKKQGYIGVEDFYNIVNTSAGMLEAAGKEFNVKGMNAAQLMEAACMNLKVVDGKLKVDLSSAGMDMVSGVNDLKDNMADGIHELADAEVAILDSEIQVLEVLAAMEEMGEMVVDVDNNGISFELNDMFTFNVDGSVEDFTGDMQAFLDQMQGAIETSDELNAAVQAIQINGTTLYDLFYGTAKDWEKTFGSAEAASKFMQKLTNIDWGTDINTIQLQIANAMKNLGQNLVIDVGDNGLIGITATGQLFNIDLDDKDVAAQAEAAVNAFRGKYPDFFEGTNLRDNVKQLINELNNPDSQYSQVEIQYTLKLVTGEIKIEEEKNDKGKKTGKFVGKYAGVKFKADDRAGVAEYIKQAIDLENQGLSKIEFNEETGEVSGTLNVGPARIKVTKNGDETTIETDPPGFDGEGGVEGAVKWLAQQGYVDDKLAGKTWSIKGTFYEVIQDNELGITYTFTRSSGKDSWLYNGMTFLSYDAMAQYIRDIVPLEQGLSDDWHAAPQNSKEGVETKIWTNGTATIEFNVKTGEITILADGIHFKSRTEADEYLAEKAMAEQQQGSENHGVFEDGDTKVLRYTSNGNEYEVQYNSTGKVKTHVEMQNGYSFDAESDTELAMGLAAAAAIAKQEAGELPGLDGDQGTVTIHTPGGDYEIAIDNIGNVTVKNSQGEIDEALSEVVTEKVNKSTIDVDLKNTISAAITEALTSLTSIEPGNLPALTVAVTELANALNTLAGADVSTISSVLQALSGLSGDGSLLSIFGDLSSVFGDKKLELPIDTAQTKAAGQEAGNNFVAGTADAMSEKNSDLQEAVEELVTIILETFNNSLETIGDALTTITNKLDGLAESESWETVKALILQLIINLTTLQNNTAFTILLSKLSTLALSGSWQIIISRLTEIISKLETLKANSAIDISISLDSAAVSAALDGLLEKINAIKQAANLGGDNGGDGGNGGNNGPNMPTPPDDQANTSTQTPSETANTGGTVTLTPEIEGGEINVQGVATLTPEVDDEVSAEGEATLTGTVENEVTAEGTATLTPTVEAIPEQQGHAHFGVSVDAIPNQSATAFYTAEATGIPGDVWCTAHYTVVVEGGVPAATGNVALATGTVGIARASGTQKTLMGELGPELVVSHGMYRVVGTEGPEMVSLARDAIVFNHLQTEQLLKNGRTPKTGRAVTNEREATSLATGNFSGPAQASASAALAQLKALRALWESLASTSISDLVGAAGSGGGGGGGGGGKGATIVDPSVWVDTVERWYNLTQKIAKLEKDITHEQTLRSKLSSDWTANGKQYYQSQKRSLQSLQQEITAQEQLNLSRRDYYNKRVEALKKSPFGKLYTFDEDGQINMQDGAMEWLTDLYGFDSNGKANHTDKEKYEILQKAGYGSYMKYDSNGAEIKMDSDNDGEITDQEKEDFYSKATQAYRDRMDDYAKETQDLYDEIREGEDNLLEKQAEMNEITKEIRDNQMSVEESVLDAIEDMRQREIDALQDERDKLEESTGKYIEGLSNALDKEQEMYETQESVDDLNKSKRRLAILERSGGSAEDIASLRSEINSSERDLYFNLQQQQIDAIQAASDLEIERMDNQIQIMTDTLEYQKEYGLLWGEVSDVMQQSAADITSFIHNGDSGFWSKSPLASADAMNSTLFQAEQWTEYRDDLAAAKESIGDNRVTAEDIKDNVSLLVTMERTQLTNYDFDTFNDAMRAEYGKDWDKDGTYRAKFKELYNSDEGGDLTAVSAAIRQQYEDDQKALQGKKNKARKAAWEAFISKKGNSKYDSKAYKKIYYAEYDKNGAESAEKKVKAQYKKDQKSNQNGGTGSSGDSGSVGSGCNGTCTGECKGECTAKCATACKGNTKSDVGRGTQTCQSTCTGICSTDCTGECKGGCNTTCTGQGKGTIKSAKGGYVGHGIYELGEMGTETVLTASQTKVLRDNILSNRSNSLISLLKSYNEHYSDISTPLQGAVTTEDNSVNIDHIEMTMQVQQIANDYDAKRAGEEALNEMMRIARKYGATNSVRR